MIGSLEASLRGRSVPIGSVTLLDGGTFCISAENGDIEAERSDGLFVRDTRFLSCLRILVDGHAPEPLSAIPGEPFEATFVSRTVPSPRWANAALLVARERSVGEGMREKLTVQNLSAQHVSTTVEVEIGVDFAHVFDVKEQHVRLRGYHSVEVVGSSMIFAYRGGGRSRELRVSLPEAAEAGPGLVTLSLELKPRGRAEAVFEFRVTVDEEVIEPSHHFGANGLRDSASSRLQEWRWNVPRISAASGSVVSALHRAGDDLGALRMRDPSRHDGTFIAAGAPWFMAMYGRDSLITSWMTLLIDTAIAKNTLLSLGRRQGTQVDLESEEQPGKILHEVRFRFDRPNEKSSSSAYFGSIDSTPLFVMLLGEARRWGLSREIVDELLPIADRALLWIDEYGDVDGDGFVEYQRQTPRGFVNQGWKDSPDGVNFASGTLAQAPIALCEVQGYVYSAYLARAELATEVGDDEKARYWRDRAATLRAKFNDAFWVDDGGYFAIGLDRDKRPIDALTSNIGHCLWTGIADPDKAASLAAHLRSDELFTGFGIRTLASSMGAYHPISYHNGSVWPHDSAIAVAGLLRYGFVTEAQAIARGLFDAADAFSGRLPELFCGFDRSEFPQPISYPSACSPQAWSSASLYLLVRSLLGFDPVLNEGAIYLYPALPEELQTLVIDNIPLGGVRATIDASESPPVMTGVPSGVELRHRREDDRSRP